MLAVALASPALAHAPPVFGSPTENPIVIENQLPGSTGWRIAAPGSGLALADDFNGQIKGYASATSVDKGGQLTLFVTVNPAQPYTVDVYRLGWYGGAGGRLVHSMRQRAGSPQPACPLVTTTGLIECAWAPAMTFTVPSTWTTGIYLGVLTNEAGYQNSIPFVVRDDARPAPLLYQVPFITYQAYNVYPNDWRTGKSLYASVSWGEPTVGGTRAAVKVSFDRPYWGTGATELLRFDQPFAYWAEQMGFDVGYASNIDLHQGHAGMAGHRAFLSGGHDEYWSRPMYDAATALRDAGVHLAFLGANSVYWQVRLEASTTGTADRVVVCYRDAGIDPVADDALKTVRWRDAPLDRPEQQLVGVQYTSVIREQVPYVVRDAGHWIYAGTDATEGEGIGTLVGGEGDRYFEELTAPPAVEHTLLSRSAYVTAYGGPDYANSSLYRTTAGSLVFASGTLGWVPALGRSGPADERVQRMTSNLFDRFLAPRATVKPCNHSVATGPSRTPPIVLARAGRPTDDPDASRCSRMNALR